MKRVDSLDRHYELPPKNQTTDKVKIAVQLHPEE